MGLRRLLPLLAATAAQAFCVRSLPAIHRQTPLAGRQPTMALEVMDPSYNLAIGSVLLGGVFGLPTRDTSNVFGLVFSRLGYALGTLFAIFGLFIAFQTTTLRFTFDDTSFSLVKADLSTTGENVVVGGENVWKFDTFVNWDFLPSERFPILVYFRETQTPAAVREEVPLVVDTLAGQVHFFPAISNTQELKVGFLKHGCTKI